MAIKNKKLQNIIILVVVVCTFVFMLVLLSPHIIIPYFREASGTLIITKQSDIKQIINRFYDLKKWRKLDQAEDLIKRALKVFPNSERLQKEMGYLLLSRDKKQEALKHFFAAKRINPKDEYTQLQIAYIYAALYNWGKANEIFKKLSTSNAAKIRNDAGRQLSWYAGKNKADKMLLNYYYLETQKKTSKAKKLLQKIIRKYPKNEKAQREMGYLLLAQNQQRAALRYFLIAAKINPRNEHTQLQIGYLYIKLNYTGYRKKARKILKELAEKSKNIEIRRRAQQALLHINK